MENLYNLGLNDNDIKNMLDLCPEIKDLTNVEIQNNIDILKSINCNNRHIRNILISNPYYLNRTSDDIIELIKKFVELKLININLLLDTNPMILNKDSYEMEEYIKKELLKNRTLKEIIDEFESNPYIIDEV